MELPPFRQPSISAADLFRDSIVNGAPRKRGASRHMQRDSEFNGFAFDSRDEKGAGGMDFVTENPVLVEEGGGRLGGATSTEKETDSTTALDDDTDLPNLWITKICEYLCFGGGKYAVVPIMWMLFSCGEVVFFAANSPDGLVLLESSIQIAYAIGLFSNITLGWQLSRDAWTAKMLRSHCHTAVARAEAGKMLERFVISANIFLLFTFIMIGYSGIAKAYHQPDSKLYMDGYHTLVQFCLFIDNFVVYAFFMSTILMASFWCWAAWLKHQVGVELTKSLTFHSILDESFVEEYLANARDMEHESHMWSTQNVVRSIVCVIVSITYGLGAKAILGFIPENKETLKMETVLHDEGRFAIYGYMLGAIAVMLFFLVWIVVAVGAYVNDSAHKRASAGICAVSYREGEEEDAHSPPSDDSSLQRNLIFSFQRTQALVRLEAIHKTHGIMFVGVILNMQKVVTLGSLLFAALTYGTSA